MKSSVTSASKPSSVTARLQGACLRALLTLAVLSPVTLCAQSTWNTFTGSWSSDLNWNPAVVPVSDITTQLLFEASSGNYTTTNDIGTGTFRLNRITVNNTGTGTITINGASTANTLTFGGDTPTLDITGNVLFTGLMAGNATITKTGPGTFIHDSNNTGFTGTIIINQGTFLNRATTNATTNFNPVSIVVNDGGTYQFGAANAGDPNLPNSTYVTANTGGIVNWQESETFGGFHLQGGTIILQTAGAGAAGSTAQNWSSGTLTGGSFTISGTTPINKTTSGTVFITGSAAVAPTGAGGLNILDGTVSMANVANLGSGSVRLGDSTGTTAGTLAYLGATGSRTGNFTVDAGNGVIQVESPTTTLTVNGSFSGLGNLSKTGAGKLRLASNIDLTGTITAGMGTLQVDPLPAAANFAVSSGATLAINSGSGFASFAAPRLNLTSETSTLQFDLDTSAVTTAPLAVITSPDGLTFSGTPTLRLTNLQKFANGTYTLLDYNGIGITSGFNLALPGRTLGNLVYDAVNTKIDVTITGSDSIKWTGGTNGVWDVGTGAGVGGTNSWKLVTAGSATNFIDTDTITFDDTATRFDVNLTTTVKPFDMAVNAAAKYTIDGPGKISGTTALNKSGTGTLVLGTDNDYSGGTVVTQGTLQLGNGGTTGSVVGPITLNGGSLGFNRSDNNTFTNTVTIAGSAGILQNGSGVVTIPNPLATGLNTVEFGGSGDLTISAIVSGSGIINKNGTGTLTLLANNNAFNGTLNVNGGTVLLEDLGGGGDLGASSVVLNNGGTFILGPNGNTDLPDATIFTINSGGLYRLEQGENYGGFILDGGEFRMVSSGKTGVNSTAISPYDGATVYDLRSGTITTDFTAGTGGTLNQGGTNGVGVLTKTTSGTVTVSGRVTFQAALPIQIKEGTLAMGISNFPNSGAAVITMGDLLTGGTMRIDGAGTATTSRPVTLETGSATFDVTDANGRVTLLGTVTGPGRLTKTGDGTLVLAGANDYAGDTMVTSGTLEVNNFMDSATGSGSVVVSGALAGDGAIITGAGKNVLINGIFQPGPMGAFLGTDFSITTGVGGKTVFGGSSIASFDLWSSAGIDLSTDFTAADLLMLAGNLEITAGATLKLTNPNALTFQNGDVFRILDLSGVGTLTGAWAIDSSGLNLGNLELDASKLYTDGTVRVIPEPSTAALALFGLTPLFLRRRKAC
ncbi:beta strand repeat-containing protein [Verrucomicrobiota bacterium sgz303538]